MTSFAPLSAAVRRAVSASAEESPSAVWVVAALTAASGLVVALRMYETHPAARR